MKVEDNGDDIGRESDEKKTESKNGNNLLREYEEANKNLNYQTTSPLLGNDYYYSEKELPFYANTPIDSNNINPSKDEIFSYIKEQAAIIIYNNPEYNKGQVLLMIHGRILFWPNNNCLVNFEDRAEFREIMYKALDEAYKEKGKITTEPSHYTRHFYSPGVWKLPGHKRGARWPAEGRAKTKQLLRQDYNLKVIEDKMQTAVSEYKSHNFNVLPTADDLAELTSFSVSKVRKYGKELYIPQKENTLQRIEMAMLLNPAKTYEELANLFKIPFHSIKRYAPQIKSKLKHRKNDF